jgi:hypothetical protein
VDDVEGLSGRRGVLTPKLQQLHPNPKGAFGSADKHDFLAGQSPRCLLCEFCSFFIGDIMYFLEGFFNSLEYLLSHRLQLRTKYLRCFSQRFAGGIGLKQVLVIGIVFEFREHRSVAVFVEVVLSIFFWQFDCLAVSRLVFEYICASEGFHDLQIEV